MPQTVDKLIVSNRSALLKKYKDKGLEKIEEGISLLIAADRRRGIHSKLIYLDDQAIRDFQAKPVSQVDNRRENKNAIDALFKRFTPDYIMILGSQDVVPHLKLTNLTGDEDGLLIDSDLPYACDRPFNRNARRFLAPTRVVGRLPDINGHGDPDYLIQLLMNATRITKRPRTDYATWFALSAKVWTGSSAVTVANMFKGFDGLSLCPPARPGEHKQLKKARIHFFNCHGDTRKPIFWGEQGSLQPPSFNSDDVPDELADGTFVAAECCYGAEQYASGKGKLSISAAYLRRRAAAYVGSTTIAYGEVRKQENADLLTQFFVTFVLRGHSVGRSFLEAQQEFLKVCAPNIDVYELKTISQFLLLGDPSLHLVERQHKSLTVKKGKLLVETKEKKDFFRKVRREQLKDDGNRIARSVVLPRPEGRKIPAGRQRNFSRLARENGIENFTTSTFSYPSRTKRQEKHYIYFEKHTRKNKRKRSRVIVFKEVGREIDVRVYEPT
jgi:hypothetical protein